MMVVALYLVALAMIAGGAAAAAQGYVYVMVEFGWTMVIAGAVVATGGAVLFGLAHLAGRLKRLEAAASRAADRLGRASVAFPEAPEGLSRLSGPALPTSLTMEPSGGLTSLGAGAAAGAAALSLRPEDSLARTESSLSFPLHPAPEPALSREPDLSPEPPVVTTDSARPDPEVAEVAPPEPRGETPSVPIVLPEEPSAPEPVEPESAPSTPEPEGLASEVAAPSEPAPPLVEPVASEDRVSAPALVERPFPPRTGAVDDLPPRSVLAEAGAPRTEELPSRGFRLRDLFSSRQDRSSAPLPEPPPLPTFSLQPDPVPAPVPAASSAESVDPVAVAPEAVQPEEAAEPVSADDRGAQEPADDVSRAEDVSESLPEAPPAQAQEPESDEPSEASVAVVGTYTSGGNQYVMFADGSIEAETPTGRYRFKSLEELKAFIETGAETTLT